MYIQSSIAFAVLALAAKAVVAATPPACLLAALNNLPNASDLSKVCGDGASKVEEAILKNCGNNVESAYSFFQDTCKANGKELRMFFLTRYERSEFEALTGDDQQRLPRARPLDRPPLLLAPTVRELSVDIRPSKPPLEALPRRVPFPVLVQGTNGTVTTGGSPTSSPPAATTTAFTGGAARSLAGSFAGVAVVAVGFVIAL
ncbi:MAG: hypothetical protein M1823_000590 [Watsoniomyces obsoletus]|nr:MAG: hypothetical protein M1823_000590 [Watsoniomyces obsoletus]